MAGKPKLWMSWWWNDNLYYCKIPNKTIFSDLKLKMEQFTTSETESYFREIILIEKEPQIGEYMPRKKLDIFLENMNIYQAERNEHTSIESMEEILENFLEEINL